MKVILFGVTGMVGQGVLRECLRDDSVEVILAVGRNSTDIKHPKLRELVLKDMFDFSAVGGFAHLFRGYCIIERFYSYHLNIYARPPE